MARPLRIEYKGAFYHVTARGNERRRIYYSKTDYEKFKAYLAGAQEKYGYLLHCYVLMPNHYHLVDRFIKNFTAFCHCEDRERRSNLVGISTC